MIIRLAVVAAAVLNVVSPAVAQEKQQTIGNWLVTTDTDRFDGTAKVIAITIQKGSAFAVRCMNRELSLALSEVTMHGPYSPGDPFTIKFRADANEVIETLGDALDDKVIEIDIPQTALGQLLSAKEYAVRVVAASGLQFDRLFKAGAAKQALASIAKECPAHE